MRSRHLAPALALLAAGGAAAGDAAGIERERVVVRPGVVAGLAGCASVIERTWFVLRRLDVPVLPAGAKPVRVLHISDAHLTPGRTQLLSWIRSLDATEPDLV